MIVGRNGSLMLLLAVALAAGSASAQNQTPANVGPPVGWTDPSTGLMWMLKDNGTDIDWGPANSYCTNLRLGGYSNWRLPTIDELKGIYDPNVSVPGLVGGIPATYHVKGNLQLSGVHWSSTQDGSWKVWFVFNIGEQFTYRADNRYDGIRALCVRRSSE
jgi:Protein of unknown function (DUF1566)